jgi:ubiquinone/menaquinone biosynthesis C-methylase UbiE
LARDYEGWYETADGKAHDRRQKAAVRRVLPLPAHGARLLDVGCGTGHWSRFFASLGFSVAAVDLSVQMVDQARFRDGTHCHFGIADACCLPFGDAAFDVVSAMAVIAFVSSAERVVAEMVRCVRDAGIVMIGALNRLAPLNVNRVAAGEAPYCLGRLLSPSELRAILAPYGTAHLWGTESERKDNSNEPSGAFIVAQVSPAMRECRATRGSHG